MDTDAFIAVIRIGATTLLGIVGLLLSLAVYRLSTRQREDAWMQHFTRIHDGFWNDDDMKEVRSWLVSEDAYKTVEHVLKKRRDPQTASAITAGEYGELEKLDKFLSLMTRVVKLDSKMEQQRELLRLLFFTYWLPLAVGRGPDDSGLREDLHWYVQEFYPTITEYYAKQPS